MITNSRTKRKWNHTNHDLYIFFNVAYISIEYISAVTVKSIYITFIEISELIKA